MITVDRQRTRVLPCGTVFRSSIHRPTERKIAYSLAVLRRHRRRCTACKHMRAFIADLKEFADGIVPISAINRPFPKA